MALLQDSTFWVLIAFVIFCAAVYKPATRALFGALDKRAEDIRAKLDEAEKLREEAQTMLSDYQRRQQEAQSEAQEFLQIARSEAQAMRERAQKDLEESLKRAERQAEDKIKAAEAKALAEVRGAAVDIAIGATEKALVEKMNKTRQNALVDSAIESMPKTIN